MKKILFVLALSIAITPQASAAPKSVPLQLGSIFKAPTGTELFEQVGKLSIFVANSTGKSADISITAQDLSGASAWSKTIDSGFDEVAMASTIDPQGNIWIAGVSALAPLPESTTSIAGIDNPDQVLLDGSPSLRTDMNQLTLWKVSSMGELLGTYVLQQTTLPQVSGISATNSGVSIIGSLDSKPFILTASTSGIFGKLISIGTSKSEFNVVVRNSDGTSNIYGSSTETLAGKKVAGVRDGILVKISKTGTITNLVRSSAQKAQRSWISGDSSNLVSGPVITGKVTETTITKFTSTFSPTWTLRLPSAGASSSLSANGNSYLALASKSAVTGISGWKPTQPGLLVITFNSKGVITAATSLPGLVSPLSLRYSKERGVIGFGEAADGTVSIFTLVSR